MHEGYTLKIDDIVQDIATYGRATLSAAYDALNAAVYADPLRTIYVFDLHEQKTIMRVWHQKPEVGTLATMSVGSDDYAGKITDVTKSGRTVKFCMNDTAHNTKFSLRQNGRYVEAGGTVRHLTIGRARDYLDPDF